MAHSNHGGGVAFLSVAGSSINQREERSSTYTSQLAKSVRKATTNPIGWSNIR